MSAAERMRRYRRRQKAGRVIVFAEVDLLDLADMLVAKGFLLQWDADDFTAIRTALERFIEAHCAERYP